MSTENNILIHDVFKRLENREEGITARIGKEWLAERLEEMLEAKDREKEVRIREYAEEGVLFILKYEKGETYEASMPIPKWVKVGKLELR